MNCRKFLLLLAFLLLPLGVCRGQQRVPSGEGWTSRPIRDGITLYSFVGVESISNARQEIYAIDLDLNNPKYSLKMTFVCPGIATSEAFKLYKAVVAMNAGYETESIFIRTAGKNVSEIPNDQVGTTGVPNWKSEAAITSDGDRNVKIVSAGSTKKGEVTLDGQRAFYSTLSTREMPFVVSSSPLLIWDYQPVGASFCDFSLTEEEAVALHYEHADRHQRVRHPRSAVALTEDNHLIMLVVDGRYPDYSLGMTARELTLFLVKWWNPQYALNMDGGASSTLCVEGEGDPETHVVNYPCKNRGADGSNHDHSGERLLFTHFVVVEK